MSERFSRTEMLLGRGNMARLSASRVAVFGIGGVGGHCAEALARSGIGAIDLFDCDRVCPSNINRQIAATEKTIGYYKTDVMRERILDINPNAKVREHRVFYLPENADSVDLSPFCYIVDAVDTISAKLELACRASAMGIPVISSMGTANKLDPTAFEVADIFETSVCPIARVMRRELRKRCIRSLKVVYSKELPLKQPYIPDSGEIYAHSKAEKSAARRPIPASNAFVPPVAGLIIAGEVIKDLCVFQIP